VAAIGAALAAGGCGDGKTHITVMGHDLVVAEQNYGTADYFCSNLSNGQFEVIVSDQSVCQQLHADGGAKPAFHDADENNLRITMPGPMYLKVPPLPNAFDVAPDVACSGSHSQAVVTFSHNDPAKMAYDVNVQADSGTVNITNYNKTASELQGNIDVMIAGQHLTASFDAFFCTGIVPGVGD
jgi:hypothetical protein